MKHFKIGDKVKLTARFIKAVNFTDAPKYGYVTGFKTPASPLVDWQDGYGDTPISSNNLTKLAGKKKNPSSHKVKAGGMTLAEAKKHVTSLGGKLTYSTEYAEYEVKFGKNTYYTPDRGDAIGTAEAMAKHISGKKSNPSNLIKAGEWIPCHAVRVRGGKLELMKDALANGRKRNPSKGKARFSYYVTNERLGRDGYVKSGRYYGTGAPVFSYIVYDEKVGDDVFQGVTRGDDRKSVMDWLKSKYPQEKI